ncbi:MAG: tripartite tricarboxylate transporter substrate binding protein [Beijerinckiaceae bacterium]|nr:tripartite tricarboxylate transporter substrate binding protein [Beijerinckiaceae bacterium]
MSGIRAFCAAVVLLLPFSAAAQTYPNKPVQIIVPYAPGGSTDLAARVLAAKLTDQWGQQVIVENRPGGNGFIGMSAGAKSKPDGYALTLATVGDVAVNPALFPNVPFSMERDFTPISMVSDAELVLIAGKNTPYTNVQDVLAAAKAQPGRLSVATSGTGTMPHILLEWMSMVSDTKFQHIPYKGGGPAAAAVAGDNVPLGILAASGVASFVKSGHIKVIAILSPERSKNNPSWPTLIESGVKGVGGSGWSALFAPKGTPPAIVEKIAADVAVALKSDDVVARFSGAGMEAVPTTPAQLAARVKKDQESFEAIIKAANVKPE